MALIIMQTRIIMKVNGTMGKDVVGEECIMQTVTFTKANGSMIWDMETECYD